MIFASDDSESYWCPMVRCGPGHSSNREVGEKAPRYAACVGSSCACWRWMPSSNLVGFCGLAGIPMNEDAEKER